MDKKGASREVWIPPPLFFIVHNQGCTEKIEGENNLFFSKIMKKRFSRPFLAHSGGGQETTFDLRVA